MNNTLEEMTKFLYLGGRHSSRELGQRFNKNIRTIQGYLKKLQEHSGLQKEKTLYYFPDAFRNIEIIERVQMSTALMIGLYKKAIPELEESVTSNFTSLPKEVDAFLFDIEFESIENQPLFNQIVSAIIERVSVEFAYRNAQNNQTTKNVFPLRVANFHDYWYLFAYDLEQEKIKTYYIKNITSLSKNRDPYLDTQKISALLAEASTLTSVWFNDDIKRVTLKLENEALRYMLRKPHPLFELEEQGEGYALGTYSYYNDIEVLSFVKKWIPDIHIVGDERLRQKLMDILEGYKKAT